MTAQHTSSRPKHHAVRFYRNDNELCRCVGIFLSDGLQSSQPAVVIATPEHREGIEADLARRGIDVATAKRLGDIVLLDADETMGTFMVNGMPDPALFRRVGTSILDAALRGREKTPLRAYGEMVNVLWKRGQADAAVRLEVLWNDLASTRNFSLLCGYDLGNFYKQTDRLVEVCEQHSHVVDAETSAPFASLKLAEAQ